MNLTIGGRTYEVASVADASALYQRLRDQSGMGASRWPQGRLTGGLRISYNGRVWRGETLLSEAAPYERQVRK